MASGGRKDTDGQNWNIGPPSSGVSPDTFNDSRGVYPCIIHHNGRSGGLYTLFAESAQARLDWKSKLEGAIRSRNTVQESAKAFEVRTLSVDTFFTPTLLAKAGPSWSDVGNFTGRVTCSVPFSEQFQRSPDSIS